MIKCLCMVPVSNDGFLLFRSLLYDIGSVENGLLVDPVRRLERAYRCLTDEIFELIIAEPGKAVKRLKPYLKHVVKLKLDGTAVLLRFETRGDVLVKMRNGHSLVRLNMICLLLQKVDLIIEFLLEFKSVPKSWIKK